MLCNIERVVTFKRIIIFGYVWLNTLRANTSSLAKRGAISVCVICQLSGVIARETPLASRRRKFLFGATNKSSDEDAKKKKNMHARQMHFYINFHHSHSAACCSKISVFFSFTRVYIRFKGNKNNNFFVSLLPLSLLWQIKVAEKKNIYIFFIYVLFIRRKKRNEKIIIYICIFSLWNKRGISCFLCFWTNDWRVA